MKEETSSRAKGSEICCRFCETKGIDLFLDLGMSPLCQTHIKPEELNKFEYFYPLRVYICRNCFLAQLDEYVSPKDIFSDYAYFSSFSDSWVKHAENYVEKAAYKFSLNETTPVLEIASNDGYLLQHFLKRGIPAQGMEPAGNVAKVAVEKGVPTIIDFFNDTSAKAYAEKIGKVNLLLGNNVLAHVPNLNKFVSGMKIVLKPEGVLTMEFPHLLKLIKMNQFDTIYHEHFSYFSFYTAEKVFKSHGITLFDVEELKSHGGSIRIYGRHEENEKIAVQPSVENMKRLEEESGLRELHTYFHFRDKVEETKRKILDFMINAKMAGKSVVGYGAPGKGNTLLNYCGIRQDFLDYTVDRSPFKQGLFTPGTRIPIYSPEKIKKTKPHYVFILPWNLKNEIILQMGYIRDWGGKFVIPIPDVEICD